MQNHDFHAAATHDLTRRNLMVLLGGAVLVPLMPRSGFAISIDFSAFNRRYIAEIIVPRFERLGVACAAWNNELIEMVRKPSAGKAQLLKGGIDKIWAAWMAIEPFTYEPTGSIKRDDLLGSWARRPKGQAETVEEWLAGKADEDVSAAKIQQLGLSRHGLDVAQILWNENGGSPDVTRAFYLDATGARRTALLQTVVALMLVQAEAAAAAWRKMSMAGVLFDGSARLTTARFLNDQIDLLDDIVTRKMKTAQRPVMDFGRRSGLEDRMGLSIMSNIETVNETIRSPAGFGRLVSGSKQALDTKLQEACSMALDQGRVIATRGFGLPTYTAEFFTTMCCFSPCPPLADREWQAAERNMEIKQRAIGLAASVIYLRNLLQTDLAEATDLSADMKKV